MDKEHAERLKEFVEFIETGVPAGLSDLKHYAEIFKTPIPAINKNGKVFWSNWDEWEKTS